MSALFIFIRGHLTFHRKLSAYAPLTDICQGTKEWQCLNPFRRRGWDGIIPTTSGEATSGRNYEFSTSHERQSQFTTSGEATSGRNWDWLEWQVENSPSLPLLLKGLSLSYRKWKLQLWGIGKQSLLVSRDWPIPYS